MCRTKNILYYLVVAAILLLLGCSKPYVITVPLEAPLEKGTPCIIGAITDALPFDFEESKKPTAENIAKFKANLAEALAMKQIFIEASEKADGPYEITGSILNYRKGSGFLRFMFGFGAGSANMTVSLTLTDLRNNMIVFSGNFTGTVTSGWESGDQMFRNIAYNFAGELQKQLKNLEKVK